MASYTEIRDLFNNSEFRNKVEVATIVHAQSLMAGTPTTAQKAWIASVLHVPVVEATKIMLGVLAANKAATVAQILGATDETIQTQVGIIAPILIDALAGV